MARLESLHILIKFDYVQARRIDARLEHVMKQLSELRSLGAKPSGCEIFRHLAKAYKSRREAMEQVLRNDVREWSSVCERAGIDPKKAGLPPMYIAKYGKEHADGR